MIDVIVKEIVQDLKKVSYIPIYIYIMILKTIFIILIINIKKDTLKDITDHLTITGAMNMSFRLQQATVETDRFSFIQI
jgi:hypothetical protein